MRRRVAAQVEPEKPVAKEKEKFVLPHDVGNEALVIVAAFANIEAMDRILRKLRPDQFLAKEHQTIWTALGEIRRRQMHPDVAAVQSFGGEASAKYVSELLRIYEPPKNEDYHIQTVLWDAARATVAKGSLSSFLQALQDPKTEPDRLRSLAKQVALGFDGYETRSFLHDDAVLIRDQMRDIEARVSGRACWSYGLPGLDSEMEGRREVKRRMVPGAAPGQTTILTATSGAGKSTTAANMAIGMAFPHGIDSDEPGRKVLYGAWEMGGGLTLELLACISLGWSRSALLEGKGPIATHEGRERLSARMVRIAERIKFLGLPFRRDKGERHSNDKALDAIQGYIADSGCEVVFFDLWKRAIRDARPEDEEDALIRQQAMTTELRVHSILVQQQRLKDVEQRSDPRPTREGIKGSGAWTEIADTIIGVHRPALHKDVPDASVELLILKQRYGKWPLAVEFEWDPDLGRVWGGKSIPYERPGQGSEIDNEIGLGKNWGNKGKRRASG